MSFGLLRKLYAWFAYPHRFLAVRELLKRPGVLVLDVGCGNHSPRLTKQYFPQCVYHGLDRGRWNRDATDDALMDQFFEIDLEQPDALRVIPDGQYDVIFCSHVLEHLSHPAAVFKGLLLKLRPGGLLYVEVPNVRTVRFPPAREGWWGIKGCLNFWDDPTHRSLVQGTRLADLARQRGFEVRRYGKRFLWRRVVLLPLYMLAGLVLRGYIPASVVWDATGFADILVVQAPNVSRDISPPLCLPSTNTAVSGQHAAAGLSCGKHSL